MIYLRRRCRRSRLNLLERTEMEVDARRLLVLLPMWASFLGGCIAGAYLESRLRLYALLVPASITFAVGSCYMVFRQKLKGYLKRLEQARLSSDLENVKDTLERTHDFLKELHRDGHKQPEPHQDEGNLVIDLEEELEGMLETMRDVEENIERIRPSVCSANSHA